MRNTFYRPSEVNHEECARITENMRETLIAVANGTIHPEKALEQARWLVNQAEVTSAELVFWGVLRA